MNKNNIVKSLVSIPCDYGIGCYGKPAFPKMNVYGWTLMETENKLNAIHVNASHTYHDRTSIQDLGDVDLNDVSQLFIIIEGVVHEVNPSQGTSWNTWVAFLSRENAERYVKEREAQCRDVFCWIAPCFKI